MDAIKVWSQKVTEKGPTYEIDAEIPHLSDPKNEKASDRLSDELRVSMQGEVDRFREEYRRPLYENEQPGSLDIGYNVAFQSPWAVSLSISHYEYTGGAHGNHGLESILYDRVQGRKTELKDLFRPGADYLGVISAQSIAAILKENPDFDETWLRNGAAPKAENFSVFFPRPEGLAFQFQPYQVACYAAGAPEAVVKWDDLRKLMRPDSPLQDLAQVDPWEYLFTTVPGVDEKTDRGPLLELGKALGSVENTGHALTTIEERHPDIPLPQAASQLKALFEVEKAPLDVLLQQFDDSVELKATDRYLTVAQHLAATGVDKPEVFQALSKDVLERTTPATLPEHLAVVTTLGATCTDKNAVGDVYRAVAGAVLPKETVGQTAERYRVLFQMLSAQALPVFEQVQSILRESPQEEPALMRLLASSVAKNNAPEMLKIYVAHRHDPTGGVEDDGEDLQIGHVHLTRA